MQKLFRVLNVRVNCLVKQPGCSSLLLHQIVLLSIDETKFKANQALTHILALGPIIFVLHHHIESVPCKESAGEGLHLHSH